jgi:hypothetical protein
LDVRNGSVDYHREFNAVFLKVYDFDEDDARANGLVIKEMKSDMDWVKLVLECRNGQPSKEYFDIAVGPTADGDVMSAIESYGMNIGNPQYDMTHDFLEIRKHSRPVQIMFRTEKGLKYLKEMRTWRLL